MYKLNCIVLGNDPSHTFEIKIAPTESVSALKKAIKDENKHEFDGVDAKALELWQVNLPIDEIKHNLSSLTLDTKKSLSPVSEMLEVFDNAPQRRHLHIVVQGPPAVSSGPLHLRLNCIVLGDDPSHAFEIKIALTESVSALQKAIKDAKKPHFDHVAADDLELWRVDLPADEAPENHTLDPKQSLSAVAKLSKFFSEQPNEEHLHIAVQPQHTVPVVPRIPLVDTRLAYLKKALGAPSAGAKPASFAATQEKEEYLCNRPRRAADSLPVTLLEPIFAEFVDDCQNYQPTAHDNDFVWTLSENMSSFHPDELTRMNVFRQLLRGYNIILHSSAIGSKRYTTDGHLLSADGNFVQVILEGKNEIGSGSAEPFAESILYYHKILKESNGEIEKLRSVLPCFHIILFGACIGFAGSLFIKKVQCDVLAPIIPLFWHSTDLRMQEMAARTFGALKIATKKLEKLYSSPMIPLKAEDSLGYPYPQTYTSSSGHNQEFSYDETQMLRDRRIFFGKTVNDATESKICIKFVRHYSPEAHRFCASKGHAPDLIAYEPLAGGWNMVIMDALDIDKGLLAQRPGSYRPLSAMAVSERLPLKEAITSLIKELHNYDGGYVHGDLRDTNFFVRDDNQFMLFDFDWAGPIEKARYPMYVNRTDIRRPEGACDGKKIVAKHDLEMLKYLFPEQDGREPVRKRPRLSTGEASTTDREAY